MHCCRQRRMHPDHPFPCSFQRETKSWTQALGRALRRCNVAGKRGCIPTILHVLVFKLFQALLHAIPEGLCTLALLQASVLLDHPSHNLFYREAKIGHRHWEWPCANALLFADKPLKVHPDPPSARLQYSAFWNGMLCRISTSVISECGGARKCCACRQACAETMSARHTCDAVQVSVWKIFYARHTCFWMLAGFSSGTMSARHECHAMLAGLSSGHE